MLVPEKARFETSQKFWPREWSLYLKILVFDYVPIFQNASQSNMNYDDFLVDGPVMELFKLFPQSYKPLDLYGINFALNDAY